MWSYWVGLCGVFVVRYELSLLWNNLLTLKEEINSEIDPLWSIEIRRHNVNVCKGFDGEVILEANLSISVKPLQYTPISVCSTIGIYTMEKIFFLSFMVIGPWNFLFVFFMLRLWYFVVKVVSAHLCFPQEHVIHMHGFAACHVSKLLIVFRLQDKNTEPNPPFTHKIWWGRPKLLIIQFPSQNHQDKILLKFPK